MYFTSTQHYSCNELNYLAHPTKQSITDTNNHDDKCIICLDNNSIFLLNRLEENNFVYKKCSCNPVIHRQCFFYWYNKKFKCPICMIQIKICEPFHKRCIIYSYRMGYFIGNCMVKIIYISINLFIISSTLFTITNILAHVIEKYI